MHPGRLAFAEAFGTVAGVMAACLLAAIGQVLFEVAIDAYDGRQDRKKKEVP